MGMINGVWRWLIGAPPPEEPNTMLLIDARSGKQWTVSDSIPTVFDPEKVPRADYPQGEFIEVLAVVPGMISARAFIRHAHLDYIFDYGGDDPRPGGLVIEEAWVPLQVRWFHPRYLKEHVAFIPS